MAKLTKKINRDLPKKPQGFTGKMRGVPIAIEHHADGSVTLCQEIVDEIRQHGVSDLLKEQICTPVASGKIYFMNDNLVYGRAVDLGDMPPRRYGELHDPS